MSEQVSADQADVDVIVDSLKLEEIDKNLYRGHPTYWERGRLFGGTVAAQALSAAYQTIDGIDVHSLHSYFLRPGDPTIPVIFDVDRIRDGRSFATRRVVARQRGEAIFNLSASFHREEDGFEHQRAKPDVPSPDGFRSPEDYGVTGRDYLPNGWQTTGLPIEMRRDHGPDDWAAEQPVRRLWFRINGDLPDDDGLHNVILTYMSDLALMSTAVRFHRSGFDSIMAASLDHSLWFHRKVRVNEWLLYDMQSPSAQGARGLNFGHLYTQEGDLVASAAQEGLMRPIDTTKT